jgi:hypothetical protein
MSKRTSSPAVVFMYLLLRDELPSGKVERLIKDATTKPVGNLRADDIYQDHELSCEHIGELAEDMCKRLGIDTW